MILVMNGKSGVGCTTIAYNLGRLFTIPIYVNKDSYMLNEKHKEIFTNISKITAAKAKKGSGVFDVGSNINTPYTKKFISEASVIVIPFDFGYETILETIKTLDLIQDVNKDKSNLIPIVLVLNRLDKQDSPRDFSQKYYLFEKLEECGYYLDSNNEDIVLTYLRNSFGIYENLEKGEFFLEQITKNYNLNINEEGINQHDFFLYTINMVFAKINYYNEEIYNQDKDMVVFRNSFKENYEELDSDIAKKYTKIINKTTLYRENKLIKDMAYISHCIKKHI